MAWQDRAYYRDESSGFQSRLGFTPPSRMALWVIGICFFAFILQAVTGDLRGPRGPMTEWLGLTFDDARGLWQPWRWISYQYLHGDALHIFFNILGIYFFLPPLERMWGVGKAFTFYTLGGVAAGALFGLISAFEPQQSYLIGASGSIFAALGACALLFPEKQVLLFFFPLPIRVLALLVGLLSVLMIIGSQDLTAAAHLGGLVFGFAAPYFGAPAVNRWQRRWTARRMQRMAEHDRREQELVDRILEKVHHHGMNSLTWLERRALRKATEHQRYRDREDEARVRRAWR